MDSTLSKSHPLLYIVLGVGIGIVACLLVLWGVRTYSQRSRKTASTKKFQNLSQILHYALMDAPSAVAVIDNRQDLVYYNPAARDLGIVGHRTVHPKIWEVAQQIFSLDDPENALPVDIVLSTSDFEFDTRNPGLLSVLARVQPLSPLDARFVVCYATDSSETVRFRRSQQEFIDNVSHELKTPLGAISLLGESIIEAGDDTQMAEYFSSKLITEVDRLAKMVRELLALVELESSAPLESVDVISVDEVVDSAVEACMVIAEQADVDLVRCGPTGAQVQGNYALLVTALRNLILNAINHSDPDSTVTISEQIQGDEVIFKVSDNGLGISREDQQNLFERFFRVDKARSRATGGSGLGLSMVKRIALNHGGDVSVWSSEEIGSTFRIVLPLYVHHENVPE